MRKLLAIYFPGTTKSFLFCIGIIFLLLTGIKLLPIDETGKEIFSAFMIFLPMVVFYFSAEAYLPNSIGWILLSPVSKKSIFLSNIIINIFKVVLISIGLILVSAYAYDLELDKPMKVINEIFHTVKFVEILELFSRTLHAYAFIAITIVLSIAIALVSALVGGSWISDYSSVSFFSNPRQYLKKNGHWILVLFFCYLCISESEMAVNFMPDVIKFPLALSLGIYIATTSTLNSLRTYYPKNKLRIAMVLFFILISSTFLFLIKRDLHDPNWPLSSKIELTNSLGPLAQDEYNRILGEIKTDPKKIKNLDTDEFTRFFRNLGEGSSSALHKEWMTKCDENEDFHCRLVTNFINPMYKDKRLNQLMKGCTNDIDSCMLVYKDRNVSGGMASKAMQRLSDYCRTENSRTEVCKEFARRNKN